MSVVYFILGVWSGGFIGFGLAALCQAAAREPDAVIVLPKGDQP